MEKARFVNGLDFKAIGKRIRSRRRELEITQENAAELAGISNSFMGHIERGEKKASVETLAVLSEILNMDLNYMILGMQVNELCNKMKKEIQYILDRYM